MFDEEPIRKKDIGFKKLVDMSIEEIEDYIIELKEEITKAEADIVKKKASRDAAASIFKS